MSVRAVLDSARCFSFFLFFFGEPGTSQKGHPEWFLGQFSIEYHKYNGFNNCLSFIRRFLPHNWVCACSHAFIACWFEKSRPCLSRTNLAWTAPASAWIAACNLQFRSHTLPVTDLFQSSGKGKDCLNLWKWIWSHKVPISYCAGEIYR